jgi:hypothetical protein
VSDYQSEPLVSPIRRRNWRDIVRFAPLTAHPHIALVVSRRGRVISVIPANARRVLSDYLDWPFEYREVDMRERLLELNLRLDSQDAGYAFTVVLQLVYQVVRPERVVVEHIDVLHEFAEAIIQRARAIAQKLGERGDVHTPGAAEQIIRTAVQRTLYRVAARFAPCQEREAAAAMTDELWNDTVLKATLAASNLELLRPAVQIQESRRALHQSSPHLLFTDSQVAESLASEVQQADTQPKDALHNVKPSDFARESQSDASPHAQMVSMMGEDKARAAWNGNDIRSGASVSSSTVSSLSPIWEDEQNAADGADDGQADMWATSSKTVALDTDTGLLSSERPAAASLPSDGTHWRESLEPVEQSEIEQSPTRSTPCLPSNEYSRHEIVARWIELLRAQDAWVFRYVVQMIVAHPEKTAAVIGDLTTDPVLCDRATDPDCSMLLAETLRGILDMESAERGSLADAEQRAVLSEEEPDWMVLRRVFDDP